MCGFRNWITCTQPRPRAEFYLQTKEKLEHGDEKQWEGEKETRKEELSHIVVIHEQWPVLLLIPMELRDVSRMTLQLACPLVQSRDLNCHSEKRASTSTKYNATLRAFNHLTLFVVLSDTSVNILLDVFHSPIWAKKALMRPSMSVCRVLDNIVTTMTLNHVKKRHWIT